MKNAVSGLGLAPDAAMVTFPIEMFLPGSDIAPVEARKREFYDGLTRWTSDLAGDAGPGEIPMVSVRGATFEDALVRANNLMIANLWGDGLPLWPATRERVEWILRGSTLPRAHVLGTFPPRGGVATVEICAIALAMAGGRPEYLPVLVAAVDAFLDPDSGSEQLQAASGSAFPVVIVNGPIGAADPAQLRLRLPRSGPAAPRRARASGARSRSLQQNVGGARPGVGTMANYGGLRYTNVVFAEDEDEPARGLAAARDGAARLRAGRNSISLAFANGATNIRRRGAKKETPEEDALQGMHRMADFMRAPNLAGLAGYEHGTPGILMIPGVVAQTMAGLGWTKRSMREFLWEHSRIPAEHLRRAGGHAWIEIDASAVTRESLALDPWPITAIARQHRPDRGRRRPSDQQLLAAGV